MSWVLVETSSGGCFSAPSHGRRVPLVGGLQHLFQPPLQLRQLHVLHPMDDDWCNPHAVDNGTEACPTERPNQNYSSSPSAFGNSALQFAATTHVWIDQLELGGHLGTVTVVVGTESDEAEGLELSGCGSAVTLLKLLVDYTILILRQTNEKGATLLLDAIFTRLPSRCSTTANATAAVVREMDGPPLRAAPLPRSNRTFLNYLTLPRSTEGSWREIDVAGGPSPPSSSKGPLPFIAKSMAADRPVFMQSLTYEAAVRRQALLYFVGQDTAPISFLFVQMERHTKNVNLRSSKAETVERLPATVEQILHKIARSLSTPAEKTKTDGDGTIFCSSPLRTFSEKLLKRSRCWALVCEAAEETGKLLCMTLLRLLLYAAAPAVERELLQSMLLGDVWTGVGGRAGMPLFAAFSPSGLLCGSPSFQRQLTHRERLLLAAAAVDQLARFLPPANAALSLSDLMFWTQWPMRVAVDPSDTGVREAKTAAERARQSPQNVMDVLLLTVGSALALVLCFPRTSPLLWSVAAMEEHLRSLCTRARAKDGADEAMSSEAVAREGGAEEPYTQSLLYVCSHSTSTRTPAFHDGLLLLTAMEKALMDGYSSNGRLRSSSIIAEEDNSSLTAQRLLSFLNQEENEGDVVTGQLSGTRLKGNMKRNQTKRQNKETGGTSDSSFFQKLCGCLPWSRRNQQRSTASTLAMAEAAAARAKEHLNQLGGTNGSQRRLSFLGSEAQNRSVTGDLRTPEAKVLDDLPFAPSHTTQAMALLSMPLPLMLCYVGAMVTRNEFGLLNHLDRLGLHSTFWFQRAAASSSSGIQDGTNATASRGKDGGKTTSGGAVASRGLAPVPQYCLSLARGRLQQPSHEANALSFWNSLDDVSYDGRESMEDVFDCVEDPSLLLQLSTQLPTSSAGIDAVMNGSTQRRGSTLKSGDSRPTAHLASTGGSLAFHAQTSVVPNMAICHLVPHEQLLPYQENWCYGVADRDCDSRYSCAEDRVAEQDFVHTADDATPLITSVYLSYPQRHRRSAKFFTGIAEETLQHFTPAVEPLPQSERPATATTADQPAQALKSKLPFQKRDGGTERWVRVEGVLNICGDVSGGPSGELINCLQNRSASGAIDGFQKTSGKGTTVKWGGASSAMYLMAEEGGFSDYPSWEYKKMQELCVEVVQLQEATHALLEGASLF